MINKLGLIMRFYKPLFIWSMAINIGLTILSPQLIYLPIIKLLLVLFTWHLMMVTGKEKRIVFFRNLGFSTFALFAYAFLVDLGITSIYMLMVLEFI